MIRLRTCRIVSFLELGRLVLSRRECVRLSVIVTAFSLFCFGGLTAAAAQPAPPGKIVSLSGIDLHYQERGSGEPLILLHGFGACGAMWGPIADELAKEHRVILPDMRGHGWSTNPTKAFTHRQSAEDILMLMDSLGIARAQAMGISSGGMTLLHLATSHPGRLDAIVLIGATTHFPEQARAILRAPRNEDPQDAVDPFATCITRGDAQVDELRAQSLGFKDSYDDMNFTAPHLGTITAQTLIVHGDRDEFFPVSIPVQMFQSIPQSQLWIVPGGGHVPIFGSSTPEFLRIAKDFLTRAQAAKGN